MDCVAAETAPYLDSELTDLVREQRTAGAGSVVVAVRGEGTRDLRRVMRGKAEVTSAQGESIEAIARFVFAALPGRCVLVVERTPEGWEVVVGAGSADPPPVAAAPPISHGVPARTWDEVAPKTRDEVVSEGVLDGLGVGVGAAAAGLVGGVAGGYVGVVATPLLCTPRPPVDPDHGDCPPLVLGAFGFVLGSIGGEMAGVAVVANLERRDSGPPLIAASLTVGTGLVVAASSVVLRTPGPLVGGAMIAVLGVPVVAGVATALAPEFGATVVPMVLPDGGGIQLGGVYSHHEAEPTLPPVGRGLNEGWAIRGGKSARPG